MGVTPQRSSTFDWRGTLRLNVLIAVGVFFLLVATNTARTDSEFVIRTLVTTFVYTFCIAIPAFYVITQFIEPVRFRSEGIAWCLVILASLGLAVVGTAIGQSILLTSGLFRGQTFAPQFTGGLKISLVVSTVAGVGKYAYDRMQQRLQRQNVALQERIESGSVRAQQQEEDFLKAREIQEGLLPKHIIQMLGYQVNGIWQPALSVGGDYYDVLPFGDSSLGMAIADVVGKGVSAALLMANLQAAVRAFASDARDPASVCEKINGVMCSNVASGKFITMFYCLLDGAKRRLTYCNAGHNPPILLHGDCVSHLEEGGALLGVFRDWHYKQRSVDLQAGDRILMFTDGVTEAENTAGVQFGEQRLVETFLRLRALPAEEIQTRILDAVRDFCAGNFRDDVTLLVIAVS
jgi:sigma-B regulation protein RsbU (phosphoserine phosphatase)